MMLCSGRTPKKAVIYSSASSSAESAEEMLLLDKLHGSSAKEQHPNSQSSSFKSKACTSDAEWKISSCSLQSVDQKDANTVTDVPNKILLKLSSGTGASSQKPPSKIKKHASVNSERSERDGADTVAARDTHLLSNEVAEFKMSSPDKDEMVAPAPKLKSKVKKRCSSNSEGHGTHDSGNTKNLAMDTGSDLPLFYPGDYNKASPDKDGMVAHRTKPHSKMKKHVNLKIEDCGNRDGTSTEVSAIGKDSGTQKGNTENLAMDRDSELPLFYPGNKALPDKDGMVAHGTKPHSKVKKHVNSKIEDHGNRDGTSTEVSAIGKDSGTQNSGTGNTKNLAVDTGNDLPLFYPGNKALPDKDGTVAHRTKPHSKMKKHVDSKTEDCGTRDGTSTEVSAIGKDTNLAPNQPSESKKFISGKDESVTPAQKPQLKVKSKISVKNKSHDNKSGSSAKTTVTGKGPGFSSSTLHELKKLIDKHGSHVTEHKTKVKKHDGSTVEESSAKNVTGVKIKAEDEGPGLPLNLPKCTKSSSDTDGTGLSRQKVESDVKKDASSAIAVHSTGDSTNMKVPGTDKGVFFPLKQPAECKTSSAESGKTERLKTVDSKPDVGFRHRSQMSAASSSTEGLQPSDNETKVLAYKREKSSSGTKKHSEAASDKHMQSKHKCHQRSLSDPRLTMHHQQNYRGIYHAAADSVGHNHKTPHQQRHASDCLQSRTESVAVSSVEKQRNEARSLATIDSANHCSQQPETLQPQTCVSTVQRHQTDSVAVHSTAIVQAEKPKSKALSLEAGDTSGHCNQCPETLQPKRNNSKIRQREVDYAAVHSTGAIRIEKPKSRVPSLEADDSGNHASRHAETLEPQMYASKCHERQVEPAVVSSADTVQAEKPKNKVVSLTDYKKRKSDPKPTVASSSSLTKVSQDDPQYMTSSLAEQLIMSYTGVKQPQTAGFDSESRPLGKLPNPVEDCSSTVKQNELQSEEVRSSGDIGNFQSILPTTQQQRGTTEFNKGSSHMVYNTTDGWEIPLSRGTHRDQVVSNKIHHAVSTCRPDYAETVNKENFTATEKREEYTSSLSTGSDNLFDIMMAGDINSKSGYGSNPLLEAELYDQRETAFGNVHSCSESDKGKTVKDADEADDSIKLTGSSELQSVVISSEATTTLHESVVANSDAYAVVEKLLDILIATEKQEEVTFPLDKNKNLSDRKEPSFPTSHILLLSQAMESDVNGCEKSQFVSVGNEDISADSVLKGSRKDSVLALSTTSVTNLDSELATTTEDTSKTEISSSSDTARAVEVEACGDMLEVTRQLLEDGECSDDDADTLPNCETVKDFQHLASEPNTSSSKSEEETTEQESVSQDVRNNEEERGFGHDDLKQSLNKAKLLVFEAKSLALKGSRSDSVVTLSTTSSVKNLDELATETEDTSKTEISSSNDTARAVEVEACGDTSEVTRQLLEDGECSDDDADTVPNRETVKDFQHLASEPNTSSSKSEEETTEQESVSQEFGNNEEDRDFGYGDLQESLNKAKVLVFKAKSLVIEAKQDVMKTQTVMDGADGLHHSDVDDEISEDVGSVSKDTLNITIQSHVEEVNSDIVARSIEVLPHSKVLNGSTELHNSDVDDRISEDVGSVSKDTLNITIQSHVEDINSDIVARSVEVLPHSKVLNGSTGHMPHEVTDMEDSALGICVILLPFVETSLMSCMMQT